MSVALPHDYKDLVYYNASLFNPAGADYLPAEITDTRTQAIVDCPEDWECSVVRFDLSAQLLPPIVVPMPQPAPVIPTGGGVFPSSLVVTLRFGGVDYQAIVQVFVPSVATYGFVFSIDELVNRINDAFAAAYALIPAPPVGTVPPVLAFNPVTQLLTLYYNEDYATNVAPIEMYVNTALYNYIVSMPAALLGNNLPSGKDFRIQARAESVIKLPAAPPYIGYPFSITIRSGFVMLNPLALSQAGPSMSSWNGVRSIVITTDLPINSESLPQNPTPGQNGTASSNSLPILSDFVLSGDPGANPVVDRISLEYLPTAEYRMCQLRGHAPVTKLKLSFFYTLFDGTINRVMLPSSGYCSAKLLFRRVRRGEPAPVFLEQKEPPGGGRSRRLR
jgi:hypothetical protein